MINWMSSGVRRARALCVCRRVVKVCLLHHFEMSVVGHDSVTAWHSAFKTFNSIVRHDSRRERVAGNGLLQMTRDTWCRDKFRVSSQSLKNV